ncbi:hypothetical protein ABXT46_04325 [Candidatus Pelagibacter sp. Uisw_104]|uniref:hypothetical protein n=1 Tax=Candidatus Pelagibacter sp. Uisw_104 TaxID=3230983 RepID=UPI0039EC4CD0
MHLRNKKTFLSKSKQSNYWGVILGLLIIATIFFLIIVNLFLKNSFLYSNSNGVKFIIFGNSY